ncbi:VOC family protein [Microbacterium thalassium]|uniref:Catechol 2,3-dioxygenase-like lactoylglutathione lyase family enzyme n=1 Tax=Microbacterium thalassium TaxID=362649 RepID=A0A7X0FS07_9MICO|nr:VOC family protein [Microbacterium thalassium]MBB6392601.1 catechol 2,3-dioxygenase-like lactoylglutathione lyase family enzyme [Microbacterium thalassium]GLK23168.1 lyase [Microbacterium thalassium]
MSNIALRYLPVTVDDVDVALAFYRNALGLEPRGDVASDGFRWVTLGFAGQPGLEIVLSEPGAGRSPDDGEALHRLLAKGSLPGPLVFSTDDLDATFERVRASGAEVLQEPMDQPWGPRDCAFRDPAGNLIRIDQAT